MLIFKVFRPNIVLIILISTCKIYTTEATNHAILTNVINPWFSVYRGDICVPFNGMERPHWIPGTSRWDPQSLHLNGMQNSHTRLKATVDSP